MYCIGAGLTGAGDDHRRVVHRAVFFQGLHHSGNGRVLLADCHVEALHAGVFLVQDRVQGNCGLAGLAVTNDQFALAAPDRCHRVDGLQSGLQRFANRLAFCHAGCQEFDRAAFGGVHRAFAVKRVSQGVQDATDHGFSNRNRQQLAQGTHFVAFVECPGSRPE